LREKNARANTQANKFARVANMSVRKTLHQNPLSRALLGLCPVSAGYLIGGWANKSMLIFSDLGFLRKAHFFENPSPIF
jgi:hypothetical protein